MKWVGKFDGLRPSNRTIVPPVPNLHPLRIIATRRNATRRCSTCPRSVSSRPYTSPRSQEMFQNDECLRKDHERIALVASCFPDRSVLWLTVWSPLHSLGRPRIILSDEQQRHRITRELLNVSEADHLEGAEQLKGSCQPSEMECAIFPSRRLRLSNNYCSRIRVLHRLHCALGYRSARCLQAITSQFTDWLKDLVRIPIDDHPVESLL